MAPTKPCSPMRRMGATDKAVKPPENLQHMHGMLNKMIVMRSRCLFCLASETDYDALPQVWGQVGVDPACGGGKVLLGPQEQYAEREPMLVGTRILSCGSQ